MPYFIIALLLLAAGPLAAEDSALRLATWNLEHLAAEEGDGCRPRSDRDYERLRHHAARLDADVIALQEVENREAVARVFDPHIYAIEISRQPNRSLGRCHGRKNLQRTMQHTGFAINRARLAELGLTYRRLPDYAAIGLESQRWATSVLLKPLDGGGTGLKLLSVHLKSGCAYDPLSGKIVRDQCRLLLQQRGILEEWIDLRVGAGERFVVLGDFNRQLDRPNDGFWDGIDDGTVCAWVPDPLLGRRCRPGTSRPAAGANLVLANAGKPFPFPFNPRYPYAIDHILFDSATARGIVPESYEVLDFEGGVPAPSDHHPVAISLRQPRPYEESTRRRRSDSPSPSAGDGRLPAGRQGVSEGSGARRPFILRGGSTRLMLVSPQDQIRKATAILVHARQSPGNIDFGGCSASIRPTMLSRSRAYRP